MRTPAEFHAARELVETSVGRVAVYRQGDGATALFVHGVPLNSFHWRHVIASVQDMRQCVAVDLLGLGYSQPRAGVDLTFPAQAEMLREVIDALDLGRIDLVGNDSGGAVAQIFAARFPERVRTLTLTNCDTHDGWPPPNAGALEAAARAGTLADGFRLLLREPHRARSPRSLGGAYADPSVLTPESLAIYLEPLVCSEERAAFLHRYITSFDNAQTVAVEADLKRLATPTQIVWGLADPFFDVRWAYWLKDTIPGAERVVEVPDGGLFFPEDQPGMLVSPLREFWARHAEA